MDGLILDTEPLYRAAWQQAAIGLGYVLSETAYSRMIGRKTQDGEHVMFDEFGPEFPIDAFRERYREFESKFQKSPLPKKRGLDQLLDLLDSRRVSKAVATSTQRKVAVSELFATGLLNRFDVVATGDDVANGKPAPDLFLLAAERLGIDPVRCLVLEDAEAGVIAAHRAGMQVYMVPDLQPPSPRTEQMANRIFGSLDQVAAHLEMSLAPFRRSQ
jgi:HAD superfamily hydrolase (TIGR01509 family)